MKATLEEAAPRRCAIYTRKSTTAGLDRAFSSLDAQREACAAYVQRQPGWMILPRAYDDGGFTGANLERPGFQELMRDVDDGQIDVVVVYKVDRLSRSLLGFAQVMERFNRNGAAFVSVTQNFSTADAMGRLTLNMLMSFAEFEREMIAERTRDKIAAARRKGKWTGGVTPMGYDIVDRCLVVNATEAETVGEIFKRYLECNSAVAVAQWLNDRGVPLKCLRKPRPRPWTKDLVLRLLRNPTYLGVIHHRGLFHPGEHTALVDRDTYDRVQCRLDPKVRTKGPVSRNPGYLVRGTLRCGGCGSVMTTASTTRHGRVYRYYRCVTRGKQGSLTCSTRQLPADAIETFVVDQLREALRQGLLPSESLQIRLMRIDAERTEREVAWAELQGAGSEASERRAVLRQSLDSLEEQAEALAWMIQALDDFENLWTVLSPTNRQRLIRTLVERVVVDEAEGQVRVHLVDVAAPAGAAR